MIPLDQRTLALERTVKELKSITVKPKAIVRGQGQLIMHQSSFDVDVSARTSEILNRITLLETQVAENVENILYLLGKLPTFHRIDHSDTPYSIVETNTILFCNTDDGPIDVTLLAGINEDHVKIMNTGSSANDVTVYPSDEIQLYGAGIGIPSILSDGEVINIHKDALEGWW